jgi:osmotically-inducible protein OsmY
MTITTDASVHMDELKLKDAVVDELNWATGVDTAHVGVSVSGGAVRLSGEVDSYPEKLLAAKAVQRVRGVTAIAQEITVRRRGGVQLDDVDVARVAGEALARAVDVPASITVSVHDHVVTLSGQATNHGRQAAVRAVAYLTGVRDVHAEVTVRRGPAVTVTAIKEGIAEAIGRNARIVSRVTVTCDPQGVVVLGGVLNTFDERIQATNAAWAAPGVTDVVDRMSIRY